jgi:hypothetical protein
MLEYQRLGGEIMAHRLVVRSDGTPYELKDKGVVAGNVSIHKRNPLID